MSVSHVLFFSFSRNSQLFFMLTYFCLKGPIFTTQIRGMFCSYVGIFQCNPLNLSPIGILICRNLNNWKYLIGWTNLTKPRYLIEFTWIILFSNYFVRRCTWVSVIHLLCSTFHVAVFYLFFYRFVWTVTAKRTQLNKTLYPRLGCLDYDPHSTSSILDFYLLFNIRSIDE